MKRAVTLALFLILSLAAIQAYTPVPQGSAKPQGAEAEPTLEVVMPQHVCAATTESLRSLDFRNLQFHVFDKSGKSILTAKLRNGKYQSKWTFEQGSDWLRLDSARFMGGHSEFAVVSLSWVITGASASDFGLVQVFALHEKHPVVVQQILFNVRGCGRSARISERTGALTIKGVHGWEHCCPKTLDVVTFRWTGSLFKRLSYESLPLPKVC